MHEGALRRIMRELGVADLRPGSGGWLHGHCPLAPLTHAAGVDRRPSFSVVARPGVSAYTCFSCHRHGRVSSLILELSRAGLYRGDASALCREADVADAADVETRPWEVQREPGPEPLDEAAYEGVFPPAWEDDEARKYLISRRVGELVSGTMRLQYDPVARRILFPGRDLRGRLYGWQGRAIDPGVSPKITTYAGMSVSRLVMGAEHWREGRPLILVEGLFALARMHTIFNAARDTMIFGALMGSSLSERQAEIVLSVKPRIVYPLLDGDEAGRAGVERVLARLRGRVNILVPRWPAGRDDPDDLTRNDLRYMLAGADSYPAHDAAVPGLRRGLRALGDWTENSGVV